MTMTMPPGDAQIDLLAHLVAIRRVRDWTRQQFALAPAQAVIIEQNPTELPGFPPVETVVAFWTAPEHRHEFKIFKPTRSVEQDDLPPSWMRGALRVEADIACSCC